MPHNISVNSNTAIWENAHWTDAQHVIRYLYATRTRSLVIGGVPIYTHRMGGLGLGPCTDMCHSMSGYPYQSWLGSWSPGASKKKQPTITTSSTEAEYIASCHSTNGGHLAVVSAEVSGYAQDGTLHIHCDTVGSNILTHDPSFHVHTKTH